jgi:hypothetical protein
LWRLEPVICMSLNACAVEVPPTANMQVPDRGRVLLLLLLLLCACRLMAWAMPWLTLMTPTCPHCWPCHCWDTSMMQRCVCV